MEIMSHPEILKLQQKYDGLEKREKTAVIAMAVFFAALLFYALVWSSIYNYHSDSQAQFDRQKEILSYLRSTESQARSAGGLGLSAGLTGQPLLQSVSAKAQQAGINPSRIQPDGSGVSVWFNAVQFNQLMVFLERLSADGIAVRQVNIDREASAGLVNSRIVLRGS